LPPLPPKQIPKKGARLLAIYHLSIKIISRGGGKSAVAAAAYRSGETIRNEYDGIVHDYSRKGGIVHTEILLPHNAPPEYHNRAVLWNAVETSERYRTAQLAREIEIALPVELTREQGISLVREYVKETFVSAGMCADLCFHDKGDGNPHAHIMLTMRPLENDGSWGAKLRTIDGKKSYTTDWNNRDKAEEWRRAWAASCNAALHANGHDAVVDHRSYERQGVEFIPTVHMGVAAARMEKRGIRTERGDMNRAAEVTNKELRQLRARLNKLTAWLKEEVENAEPNIQEVFSAILHGGENKTYWQRNRDLNTASKILIFLQANNIYDLAGLRQKVSGMYGQRGALAEKLNKIDRRQKVLTEHLKQAENLVKHKAIYKIYKQTQPKMKADFYENHRAEIILYESAERYIRGVMNGNSGLPVKAWKAERVKLDTERKTLMQDYLKLKEEVQQAEIVRRGVEDIMRGESRDAPMQTHGIAL
jgi:hypothetical protein